MSLFVDCTDGDDSPVRAEAEAGQWITVTPADPDTVVGVLAGTAPGHAGILLEGTQLGAMTPDQRHDAGLGVATCRLGPLPTLRVADILLLGLRAPRPSVWHVLLGTARARAMNQDDVAQVRALAGRLGLARWIDRIAVDLPPHAEALADVGRALAGRPSALVLRRPQWLDPPVLHEVCAAVADEQRRDNFALLEFCDAEHAGPGPEPGATLDRP